jgi:hypothetical protein
MSLISRREYKGESELEYYGKLSPDDGPEFEECEGCGDLTEELHETSDMVLLCKACYDELEPEDNDAVA